MTKINILEFAEYDSKAIYEFLFLQNETEFEIIIPRENSAGDHEDVLAMIDYLNAAYAGQLLSKIASHFAYYVPCPLNKAPFFFQLLISNIEIFADTLHIIIQGFNIHAEDDDLFMIYQDKAATFLNEAYDEDYECNTWGLLYIANKLL